MDIRGQMYALRVLTAGLDRQAFATWLASVCSAYLVVLEVGTVTEKEHVHCALHSDKKLSAVRKSFQRAFSSLPDGNGTYSLKECDDDWENYLLYMCKGASKNEDPVVWLKQGLEYTDERIAEFHERYWVNNAQLEVNKRKRKAFSGTVVEVVEKLAKEKGLRHTDREEVAKLYIKHYVELRKPINSFAAKAVVNTVCVLLDEDNDSALSLLAAQIAG